MSVIYNTQYVDEVYSDSIEPNLYYDSILIPEVTYTEKYKEKSGGIFIHKLTSAGFVAPTTPASDFSHTQRADTLIQVVFNNNFKKSGKIFGVSAAAVGFNKAEEELAETLKEISEGWQLSGLACLMNEGTDAADTTALTTTNIKAKFIGLRKTLKLAKAKPNFSFANPTVYATILEYAGDDFTPTNNDRIVGDGNVGRWFGVNTFEANALAETVVTYYNYAGSLITLNLSYIDIIMGDYRAFSVINNFEAFRIIDAIDWAGSAAQVEWNTAYRVTNSDRILVKYNATPSA